MNHGEYGLNVGLPSEEKLSLLVKVLQSKYLIVLDNFEGLLENGVKKDFETLLESLLIHSHRSKVLITTRRSFDLLKGRLSGNIAHIVLGGLQVNHSLWLMERLGISVSVGNMVRIYEKTGGHPYAIEFVRGLLREEPLENILKLPISREDILDLLEEVFRKLELEELAVLKQISVLRRPEYIEALEYVAEDKKGCIKPLLGKTVLFYDKKTELYYLHALVREYAYRQLEDKKKAHMRAAKYYEAIIEDTKDIWDVIEVWYHDFEAGEHEKAGEIVNGIEEYLRRWGYWQMVKELLEKTVETTEGSLQASSLVNLGIVCGNLGEYGKALEHYEKSLNIFKECDNKSNISAILHNIGVIYQHKGDYEKALKYYEESLKIKEELGNKSGIAVSLHNIGVIYQDRGDYEKALKYYEESLNIEEELGDKSGIADSLHNIGNIHYLRGDYEKALKYYEESLKIKEELGNKSGIAVSLGQIGLIYQDRGDYEKALKYYEESLKIEEKLGNKSGIADSLHNIGNIHYLRGDYEKALKYYEESLKIKEELGNKSGIADSLHNIGVIYQYRGDYEKALKYYEESLKIKEELGNKSGIAVNLHQIGLIYQDRGDYEKALKYYEESLKIKEEIGDKSGIASSLGQISRIYFFSKDYEKCLKLNLISIKIFEYLGSPKIEIVQADLDEINQELGDENFHELLPKISNEVEAELSRLGITP